MPLIRKQFLVATSLLIASLLPAESPKPKPTPAPQDGPWVFVGFKGNSTDGVYYALSRDGYHWHLANHGKPIFAPTEKGELMRDPFLQRAPDSSFRMVWTWSWYKPAVLGYSSSTDLLNWTPHRQLPVLANEPTARNAWAPVLFWESDHSRWLLFWSTTIPDRFPGPSPAANGLDHRIFATYTTDFTTFTPAAVYFDPGYSVIDATMLEGRPTPTLIFKDERETPLEKHLQTVTAPTLDGPFSKPSEPFTEVWSEGPASIAVHGGTLVYYDHYRTPQHYGAVFSSDGQHWTDASKDIDFPSGLRHGSFLKLTETEYQRLDTLP